MSNSYYSFEQWCVDNNREDILKRWDKTLNKKLPSEVSFKSNQKYWFKCPRNIHESQLSDIQFLSDGRCKDINCKKCNSFAQKIIDDYDIDYFNDVWNSDNTIDPWNVSKGSKKKALFNCLNNKNHVYEKQIYHFAIGSRCPYCSHNKIDVTESLGSKYPKSILFWSVDNEKTPYDFYPFSNEYAFWKCNTGRHPDYRRVISSATCLNFECPECKREITNINKREDISQMVFGELTAISIDKEKTKKSDRTYWICKCSCGKIVSVPICNLKAGNSTTCGNRLNHYSKENNGNWKGGVTPIILSERTSKKYNTWRDLVYKKDWYTCQCCGKSHNINKNAHHILNFSKYEDLRYDVSNGILLCDDCHSAVINGGFHNIYGIRDNTPDQLEKYINDKRKILNINISFSMSDYLNGNILKPNDVKEKSTYV